MGDNLVEVLAIADINPVAPGMLLAKQLDIPTYTDAVAALQACKAYPDCIVYNLSHDDSIAEKAALVFGDQRVAGGHEVKLFWQMVTNLKQIKEELEKSQLLLQSVIHNALDGIITTNEAGDIQGFNPAAEKIFGYLQEEIIGKNVKILMPAPDQEKYEASMSQVIQRGSKFVGVPGREVMAARKDGEKFPMEISLSEMILGGLCYYVGIVRDITERKLAEQKIAHLAHHDYLTGLPNRARFMASLELSANLAKRNKYKVALLFLDLDGFKKINDVYGHDAGDLLLQEVANRLSKVIRASDNVARIGGDEFILVLNNIQIDADSRLVASKIIAALSEPFDLKGQECHVGGSIGVSIFPDDTEDLAKLLKQADEAMYHAKQNGKNTSKFYRDVLREQNSPAQ